MSGRKSAIIVGAGVGGVATAARLASARFDVTVLEMNDHTGGRCSIIERKGYRFDQGPSLVLLPRLFEEAFTDVGTSMQAEGIQLVKCDPNYRILYGDGEEFTMSTDLAQMKLEIERFEGESGFEGFLKFMTEAHRHYELSVAHVLHKNFTSLLSMLRPEVIKSLATLHPFESIYSRASLYFKSDRLRRAFTFASMYMGMSPYDALGTYSLLQYTELAEGIWYPIGGFHKIVQGLVNVAKRKGVNFRLSTKVSQVLLDPDNPKKAIGVKLASGEELKADVVVVNSDLIWSLNNLFEPTRYSKRLAAKPVSCSSISFYWSMDRKVPGLKSHTIFLADEYRESFDSIFKDHTIPHEPSFYVNVPGRVDPEASPEGKDALVILVPTGHISKALPEGSDWQLVVDKAREQVLSTMEKRLGLPELRKWIIDEETNTPITWRDKFNLHRGSILGLSHSFFNVLSFRPPTKHSTISNAYFVGASVHPGTGVPICLAGARITSEQICSDLGVKVPWGTGVLKKEATKALDRIEKRNGSRVLTWVLALLVVLLAVYLRRGNQ